MEIDLTIEQTGPHEAIPYELLYEADPLARSRRRLHRTGFMLHSPDRRPYRRSIGSAANPSFHHGTGQSLRRGTVPEARHRHRLIAMPQKGRARRSAVYSKWEQATQGSANWRFTSVAAFRSSRSKRTISSGITRSRSTKTESSAGTWFGSEWNYNRRQPDSTGRRHANGGTGIRGRSGRYAVETASDG